MKYERMHSSVFGLEAECLNQDWKIAAGSHLQSSSCENEKITEAHNSHFSTNSALQFFGVSQQVHLYSNSCTHET